MTSWGCPSRMIFSCFLIFEVLVLRKPLWNTHASSLVMLSVPHLPFKVLIYCIIPFSIEPYISCIQGNPLKCTESGAQSAAVNILSEPGSSYFCISFLYPQCLVPPGPKTSGPGNLLALGHAELLLTLSPDPCALGGDVRTLGWAMNESLALGSG